MSDEVIIPQPHGAEGYTEVSLSDPAWDELRLADKDPAGDEAAEFISSQDVAEVLAALAGELVRSMAEDHAARLAAEPIAGVRLSGLADDLVELGIASPGKPTAGPGFTVWADQAGSLHDPQRDGSGQFAAPRRDPRWSHTLANPANRSHLISGRSAPMPEGGDVELGVQPVPPEPRQQQGQQQGQQGRRRRGRRVAYGRLKYVRQPARQHTQGAAADDDFGSGTGVDTGGPGGGMEAGG